MFDDFEKLPLGKAAANCTAQRTDTNSNCRKVVVSFCHATFAAEAERHVEMLISSSPTTCFVSLGRESNWITGSVAEATRVQGRTIVGRGRGYFHCGKLKLR